jgi:hypothetical protein
MPVAMKFHTGFQNAGASVQPFNVDMAQAQAQIVLDFEFNLLRFTAGTNFGLPSPGKAILTRDVTGDYLVDSFFDITYRVDFVGNPGGLFAGMSGSTTSGHRQRVGIHTNGACGAADNGLGTADWTPFCGWIGKTEQLLYDGGAGTFLIGRLTRTPPGGLAIAAGGPYGGQHTNDNEGARLEIAGEGALAGYLRNVTMSMATQHDLGPIMTGGLFQGRISEGTSLFAQLPAGDPDFDLLRLTGGTGFAMASAGHTSLLRAGPNWLVDSFFDITYRVDFVGHAPSPLAGHAGSTNSSDMRAQTGRERRGYCIVPDNGLGTVQFPPFTCANGFRGPLRARGLLNGMPAGSPVLVDIEILPLSLIGTIPGGPLGGEMQDWNAKVIFHLTGAGGFLGYTRTLSFAGVVRTATGPVTLGSNPQHFETDLLELFGQIPIGDPDFDLLRIVGGTSFGLPSPGYTNLTSAGGGNWNIDSFFDIAYRIDFIGRPLGPFGGMSGSTTDRQRFVNGDLPTLAAPPPATPVAIALSAPAPNPTPGAVTMMLSLPNRAAVRIAVHDVAGRLVRVLENGSREAGVQAIAWDGTGAGGTPVRPGLYIVRVDVDGAREARRVMVSR